MLKSIGRLFTNFNKDKMKSSNIMLASLLILIGVGAITVSCRKQQFNCKAKVEITPVKNGGEDDDDPIIQGRVKKKHNLSPIAGAYVETISYSSDSVVRSSYSNDEGEFKQQVPANTYYFRVTIPGGSKQFITDTVGINANSLVEIVID